MAMPKMSLRGMFWTAVGMGALAMGMVVTMGGSLPLAMFTMSALMATAAWLKQPPKGDEVCLCGHRPPEASRYCNDCGARMPGARRLAPPRL